MTKLKSFGCSFIFGSELSDAAQEDVSEPSMLTWPALIAGNLNLEYECWARAGQGNFKIYCDILANSYANDDSVYVINWTWIDRFDYIDQFEHWDTLRPAQENQLQKFYYKNLHSQFRDMISNATYIISAAEHLKSLNCRFIMTYMDQNLFANVADLDWDTSEYPEILQQKQFLLQQLQQKLGNILVNFDDLNFLDWSRLHNYKISSQWHPLEDAHAAAADYWLPAIKQLL